MRHFAARVIEQMKLHLIALADADEAARHVAAEGPKQILDAVRELLDDFAHLEFDDHLRRVPALDRRRDQWRLREDGFFFAGDFRIDALRGDARRWSFRRRFGGVHRRKEQRARAEQRCRGESG